MTHDDHARTALWAWVPAFLSVIVVAASAVLVARRWTEVAALPVHDLATALAGLSSTLALIWLVYGYRMQAAELRLQREQLAGQREELRLQRLEFAKMVEAQTAQGKETARLADAAAQQLETTLESIRNADAPVIIPETGGQINEGPQRFVVRVSLHNTGGRLLSAELTDVTEPWVAASKTIGNLVEQTPLGVEFSAPGKHGLPSFAVVGRDPKGRAWRQRFWPVGSVYRSEPASVEHP